MPRATLGVEFDIALTQPMIGRNFRGLPRGIITDHYGAHYPDGRPHEAPGTSPTTRSSRAKASR